MADVVNTYTQSSAGFVPVENSLNNDTIKNAPYLDYNKFQSEVENQALGVMNQSINEMQAIQSTTFMSNYAVASNMGFTGGQAYATPSINANDQVSNLISSAATMDAEFTQQVMELENKQLDSYASSLMDNVKETQKMAQFNSQQEIAWYNQNLNQAEFEHQKVMDMWQIDYGNREQDLVEQTQQRELDQAMRSANQSMKSAQQSKAAKDSASASRSAYADSILGSQSSSSSSSSKWLDGLVKQPSGNVDNSMSQGSSNIYGSQDYYDKHGITGPPEQFEEDTRKIGKKR